MKNTLLPVGFYDSLPPSAAAESRAVSRLIKRFAAEGYEAVTPPLMEFEESLTQGIGKNVSAHMFRVMDPISHKMLGIRADMTPQVVRIADTLLKNKPRPLRLAYAGQVLRVSGEGLNPRRQLRQAGIELLGSEAVAADAEVVRLVADALSSQKIKGLSVDFNLPLLLKAVLEEAGVGEAKWPKILRAIEQKNADPIRREAGKAADILVALLRAAGPLDIMLPKIRKLKLPKEALVQIDRLEKVAAIVGKALPDLALTIDALEQRGFDYHAGISFAFFAGDAGLEIARGGRYYTGPKSRKKGGLGDAVGCTIGVEAMLSAMPNFKKPKKLMVPATITPEVRAKLLRDKYTVIQSLESDIEAEAKRLKCGYVYKNNKVQPLK